MISEESAQWGLWFFFFFSVIVKLKGLIQNENTVSFFVCWLDRFSSLQQTAGNRNQPKARRELITYTDTVKQNENGNKVKL